MRVVVFPTTLAGSAGLSPPDRMDDEESIPEAEQDGPQRTDRSERLPRSSDASIAAASRRRRVTINAPIAYHRYEPNILQVSET